jgi:hypothetical protein
LIERLDNPYLLLDVGVLRLLELMAVIDRADEGEFNAVEFEGFGRAGKPADGVGEFCYHC